MTVVHLPDDLANRLTAEAARRGVTVDELAAEALADRYRSADRGDDVLEAFIGSGDSGDPSWAARPAVELRTEAYKRQAG